MTCKPEKPNPLLTTEEAAGYLCQSKNTLVHWRRSEPSYGPRWIKVGRRIYYRATDLDEWIDEMCYPIHCYRQTRVTCTARATRTA